MAHHFPNYIAQIFDAPVTCVALSTPERSLTYGELLSAASSLSAELCALGLPPEARIGICMERGLLAPVSLLACLLSGHTYVPLDPGYPAERLGNMAQIADLATLLCDANTSALITHPQALLVDIDRLLAAPTADTQALWTQAAAIAYVIFTSGSTGAPKAVAMPHDALANLLQWQSQDAGFAKAARVLQFTPISFDVHFQELFHTWSTHGEVCVVKDADRRDPMLLLRHIEQRKIERLYLPFVALAQMTEAGVASGLYPCSLRDVVTAGEQLVVSRKLRTFFSALTDARLHNQYGPSESHVVTAHTLTGSPDEWPELPAIGTPIEHVWLELLDDAGLPVAGDQAGELYIGGACLAAGYFGAQALTEERFVSRPLGRAYRSGDLACRLADGSYSYLGRVDQQLKIRGHRVEPGEIEAAIAKEAAVAACAVAGRMVSADEQALMAYVVAKPEETAALQAQGDALNAWQAVWDGTYAADADAAEPAFDLRGWNSSFTGKQLAKADMRCWVDQTCERIMQASIPAPRILELGCGTGLFAFALADQCKTFLATDYSAVTIDQLEQRLQNSSARTSLVTTRQLAADQAHTLGTAQFDTIIINSLTQHFVSFDYLLEVIESALAALAPGGTLFFGDITSKTTRLQYFAAVEAAKMPADSTGAAFLDQVSAKICSERELVIEPWFFFRIAERFPRIQQAKVQLKGAGYNNELADYRYDVTFTTAEAGGSDVAPKAAIQTWEALGDVDSALSWLTDEAGLASSDIRYLAAIPNTRVAQQTALLQLAAERPQTALSQLTIESEARANQQRAVNPALFHALELDLQEFNVLTFHSMSASNFDVVLTRKGVNFDLGSLAALGKPSSLEDHESRALRSYTSTPVNMAAFSELEQRLRKQLDAVLPEYMLPSRYIPLSALPLTASGKLDRRRLPAPATTRPPLGEPFVAPTGAMQERIANIWRSRLMLDQVGVNDNFFDLGGSSLQSLKICAEMSELLALPVPVVALFQYPTVAALSQHLADPSQTGQTASPARQAQRRTSTNRQQQAVAAHRARVRQRKQ